MTTFQSILATLLSHYEPDSTGPTLALLPDSLRLRSGHLYQLHAYLTNKAFDAGWGTVEGMLLYPSNGYSFDHAFTLHGRPRIRVSTIDLNQDWREIESGLMQLLLVEHPDGAVSP